MKELKKTNVSMGIMLENVSERLTKKGMPHYLAASKKPQTRLKILENSGKLGIPMTTGILVGIGETIEEIIDSILAIKKTTSKIWKYSRSDFAKFSTKTRYNHERLTISK